MVYCLDISPRVIALDGSYSMGSLGVAVAV
jgi:hypothetical protein